MVNKRWIVLCLTLFIVPPAFALQQRGELVLSHDKFLAGRYIWGMILPGPIRTMTIRGGHNDARAIAGTTSGTGGKRSRSGTDSPFPLIHPSSTAVFTSLWIRFVRWKFFSMGKKSTH
jgi:hypothetical protein